MAPGRLDLSHSQVVAAPGVEPPAALASVASPASHLPHRCSPGRATFNTMFIHDLTLDVWAQECVFKNSRGLDLNTDMHRGGESPRGRAGAPLRTRASCRGCNRRQSRSGSELAWPGQVVARVEEHTSEHSEASSVCLARPQAFTMSPQLQGPTTTCGRTFIWERACAPLPAAAAASAARMQPPTTHGEALQQQNGTNE